MLTSIWSQGFEHVEFNLNSATFTVWWWSTAATNSWLQLWLNFLTRF